MALRGVDHTALAAVSSPDPDSDAGGDTASPGGQQLLEPDSTPNPALHRFLDAATRRGVDEFAPLLPPEDDTLTQQLLGPPLPALPPAAAEALAALPAVFPLKPTVRQAVCHCLCVQPNGASMCAANLMQHVPTHRTWLTFWDGL